MFRSGRTCHGNHPGPECRKPKKHALNVRTLVPQEVNPEESPVLKKVKTEEPEDHLEAKRARVCLKAAQEVIEVSKPKYVDDDSIMRKLLPELRQDRFRRRGNRLKPEPPRLVAKVCEEEGKCELWLGPLPTAQRMDVITETEHSIQILSFRQGPNSSAGGVWW